MKMAKRSKTARLPIGKFGISQIGQKIEVAVTATPYFHCVYEATVLIIDEHAGMADVDMTPKGRVPVDHPRDGNARDF